MSEEIIIPLILRGEIIEDNLKDFGTRGAASFRAPDLREYLPKLVLQNPVDMSDLYELSLEQIIDYLVELGARMYVDKNPHIKRAYEVAVAATDKKNAEMTRNSFLALPGTLKRDVIEEIIEHNIGRQFLEDWVPAKLLDGRTLNVRAFGARTAHIIAGNGSTIALQTIAYNALTRGDAIIKLPSNDPYFSTAVARTMIEMAPNHPLTKHLSVAYWKGGDEVIEKYLYDANNLEKVVAWGGFDSMRSIRNYLQPGIDLVALDPKLSASIIGREAFDSEESLREVAELAARDIGYFNQSACASARTLFVECGTDAAGVKRANQLGKLIFEAVQALPESLSSAAPEFSPVLRDEIEGIRYSDDFRVIGGKGNEGAVIVSQGNEVVDFSDRLDCRVANLVPVNNVDSALRHLTIHTQTIGVYPNTLKTRIRNACALRGGQRIMPLGFALAGSKAGPHDAMEVMRRMVRWIRDDTLSVVRGTLFVSEE